MTPSPATLSETPLMDLGIAPDNLCGGDASGCCDAQSTVNLEAPLTSEKIVDNVAFSSEMGTSCKPDEAWEQFYDMNKRVGLTKEFKFRIVSHGVNNE
ncbi:hypothetical protein J6590_091341 [Homalodisca vitripennis]|nr:hypothetical protein J6590_091341 [Homalodisca vitripennis]